MNNKCNCGSCQQQQMMVASTTLIQVKTFERNSKRPKLRWIKQVEYLSTCYFHSKFPYVEKTTATEALRKPQGTAEIRNYTNPLELGEN